MKHFELKKILEVSKDTYICFFGAGFFGCTWTYDLLKAMGGHIDFYCDNNKKEGMLVRDGIKTISLEKLYALKDNVLVFITTGDKYQHSIKTQLEKNGIHNIIRMDYIFLQTFIESLTEMDNSNINEQFKCILDDENFICRKFEYYNKYRANLNNPRSFNEKLQWLKLHDHNPKYTRLVDKYEVKKYVADKVGADYVVPTLGIYDSFDDIDFEEFPHQFVLKCTHDSGSIIRCTDKDSFDRISAKDFLNNRLKFNFFWAGREWPYKNVNRRIIAEKYLENTNGQDIIDYKFLCAAGIVKYIFTCTNRTAKTGLCVNFYERDWTPLPFERHYHKREKEIEKPDQLSKMIELAEKLSSGLGFVRVDFFIIDGHIYFSEYTFFPGGGMEEFTPVEWDYKLGEMINLDLKE